MDSGRFRGLRVDLNDQFSDCVTLEFDGMIEADAPEEYKRWIQDRSSAEGVWLGIRIASGDWDDEGNKRVTISAFSDSGDAYDSLVTEIVLTSGELAAMRTAYLTAIDQRFF